jgi:NitT/TauT family transport system permease protein
VPPLALCLLVLTAWQAGTAWFDTPKFLLPAPLAVFESIISNLPVLASATAITGAAAVSAFAASLVIGTAIGFVFSQSPIIRNSGYPYAIFLQTVPIIAIAPLIVTWFGRGFSSVVIVGFIISVFPIITAATAGLTAIDADLLDFFRLHNASRWQLLWKLRLPSAVPQIITGAKTSSGVAVIGAIVGEFFAGLPGKRFGLGYLVRQKADMLKTDELFAAVIASTLLGVVIFTVVNLAGATILARWYDQAADA